MTKIAKGRTHLATALAKHGPLYCRAVVPFEAEHAWRENDYSPWFLCHTSWDMLADDVIDAFYQVFGDPDLDTFFAHLERNCGYLVLNSGPGGVCWLE